MAIRFAERACLPHVSLHGVEVIRCTACGRETLAIPRVAQLHRIVADQIVSQRRMLAPIEIRFLRKHVGLSATDFAQRMGVARETVSRWETGATSMGPAADRLLRLIVVTHEPSDNYVVDDLLRDLDNTPAPAKLASVAMQNDREKGWAPQAA